MSKKSLNIIGEIFTAEIKEAQIDTLLPLISDETTRENLYHYMNNLYSLLDMLIQSFLDKKIKSLNYKSIFKLITASINVPIEYLDLMNDVFNIIYKALQKAIYYLLTDVHDIWLSNMEVVEGHHVLLEYFYRHPERKKIDLIILEKQNSRLATWIRHNT